MQRAQKNDDGDADDSNNNNDDDDDDDEWSTIQGVIARVISQSNKQEGRGRFEIMSMIAP